MWQLGGETGLQQENRETGLQPEGLGPGPPLGDPETGPPPEDLRNDEEGLTVRTQWMTS